MSTRVAIRVTTMKLATQPHTWNKVLKFTRAIRLITCSMKLPFKVNNETMKFRFFRHLNEMATYKYP